MRGPTGFAATTLSAKDEDLRLQLEQQPWESLRSSSYVRQGGNGVTHQVTIWKQQVTQLTTTTSPQRRVTYFSNKTLLEASQRRKPSRSTGCGDHHPSTHHGSQAASRSNTSTMLANRRHARISEGGLGTNYLHAAICSRNTYPATTRHRYFDGRVYQPANHATSG